MLMQKLNFALLKIEQKIGISLEFTFEDEFASAKKSQNHLAARLQFWHQDNSKCDIVK